MWKQAFLEKYDIPNKPAQTGIFFNDQFYFHSLFFFYLYPDLSNYHFYGT